MTLQVNGPISLGNLKNEFGGNASPKLSDYYKNGAFNNNTLSTVPSSGTIVLSKFYGASKIQNTVFKSSGADFTYRGVEGDKIVFPNGSIHTVTNTQPIRISGSNNAGIFTIIHSQTAPTNLPILAGPGITEIHSITNLPQVKGLEGFELYPDSSDWVGFKIYTRPSLIAVPSVLPKNITYLGSMFSGATNFNQNISGWDVSNVTDMGNMFGGARSFNQPIGNWNVSNVTNMGNMFGGATNFNQNISGWNVSNVTNMGNMFGGARSFNQPIGNWNVSNVTNMGNMFGGATNFNQNISGWNVSNVTNMGNMFDAASAFNQPIGGWNVSKVTDMSNMFSLTNAFNQPIGSWAVGNVTNMTGMFGAGAAFNQYLGDWCVSKITKEPTNFARDAPKFLASNKPKWGTCSRGY